MRCNLQPLLIEDQYCIHSALLHLSAIFRIRIDRTWMEFLVYLYLFLCGNNCEMNYRQVSNIRRTLVGNEIVDHSDIVGASPVGAAPTTSSSRLNTWLQWIGQKQLQDETRSFVIWCVLYRDFTVCEISKLGLKEEDLRYLTVCYQLQTKIYPSDRLHCEWV